MKYVLLLCLVLTMFCSVNVAHADTSRTCGQLVDWAGDELPQEQQISQDSNWRCGSIDVPLDHSGTVPGSISIRYARLHRPGPPRPTLVALAGGPGEGAFMFAGMFKQSLDPLLQGHDMLVIDQRGTGASGYLPPECFVFTPDVTDFSGCPAALGSALSFYRTSDSVQDIEFLRNYWSIPQLDVYGVSYGTVVAQTYAHTFGEHTGRVILDSTTGPNGPALWRESYTRAMPRVLGNVCARNACPFTRSIRRDFARVLAMLRPTGSITGIAFKGRGKQVQMALSSNDLFAAMVNADFDPSERLQLVGLLHQAAVGDTTPLLAAYGKEVARTRVKEDFYPLDNSLITALTNCEDLSMPWNTTDDLATRKAAIASLHPPDYGWGQAFVKKNSIPDMCLTLPNAGAVQPIAKPFPNVPMLIVNGEEDVRTPIEEARKTAKLSKKAQLLTVPHEGHSVLFEHHPCVTTALRDFAAGKTIKQCHRPTHTVRAYDAPVRLYKEYSRGKDKPLRAVLETILQSDFLVNNLDSSNGNYNAGLRGGYVHTTEKRSYHHYRYLQDVTVDGTSTVGKTQWCVTLRVSGAVHGKITIDFMKNHIVGKLNNHPIDTSTGVYDRLSKSYNKDATYTRYP